jgi:hypothetical protein
MAGKKKPSHHLNVSVKIVIIYQGREDIFLSRGSLSIIKKRGLKLSSLPWCIYYFFHY